jgi:GntR family transcriptional regulator
MPGREIRGGDLDAAPVAVSIAVETTQCGQFEADLLAIPNRSTFLLSFGSVHRSERNGEAPVEVFRLGFRGDSVQLDLKS